MICIKYSEGIIHGTVCVQGFVLLRLMCHTPDYYTVFYLLHTSKISMQSLLELEELSQEEL